MAPFPQSGLAAIWVKGYGSKFTIHVVTHTAYVGVDGYLCHLGDGMLCEKVNKGWVHIDNIISHKNQLYLSFHPDAFSEWSYFDYEILAYILGENKNLSITELLPLFHYRMSKLKLIHNDKHPETLIPVLKHLHRIEHFTDKTYRYF